MKDGVARLLIAGCLVVVATPVGAQVATPTSEKVAAGLDEQEERDEEGEGETVRRSNEIVVTGTRIRRPNSVSAAPITSITAAEIEAQAAVNVEEVLNRLPQIQPDSQQNYGDSDGRQRIKLRGLGFERTLTLVDGLRLGTQNAQDVNSIPVALLERIDLLSGGASSVYGSDAISGVVNFILKKDFEGFQLNANYNFFNHLNRQTIVQPAAAASAIGSSKGAANDGGRSDVSLTAGKRLLDGRLGISAFGNYRAASLIPYDARSSSACYLVQATRDGPVSCQVSSYSTSGYVSPRTGANNGATYVNDPDGSRRFVPYARGAGNAANPFDGYSFQRDSERYNAGGFGNLTLADIAEVYGTAIWFRDVSVNSYPARVYSYTVYGNTPYQVNCNNPYLSGSQSTALCGAQAGTSTKVPVEVRYRFGELADIQQRYTNAGIRATGGVRGDVGGAWHYDIGGVFSRNRQDTGYAPYPDFDKVNRSLDVVSVGGVPTCASKVSGVDPDCVPFDAFRAGNSSQALADYLFTGRDGTVSGIGLLFNGIATVTGDLGEYGVISPWAEQGVAIALGSEYRKDRFISTADSVYRDQYGGSDEQYRQDVWEANVELQMPLVEKRSWAHLLQVNGGYRVSKYSSNAESFNTWKVEGLWAPSADFMLRGSINKSQRAPTVIETAQASNLSYATTNIQDPCGSSRQASIEACRATGLPDSLYGSATLDCPNDQCTVRNAGYDLVPETAFTKTFGLVLTPRFFPGLSLSIDRYLIDLEDSIGYNDLNFYVNGCINTADAFYCSGIVRNPGSYTLYSAPGSNPETGFFRQGTSNFFKGTSHGWDFQAQYALPLGGAGRLDWAFNGSRPTIAGGQDAPDLPARNCVGYFGTTCGQSFPKWQHGLRTTYTTADGVVSASLNWRYIGPMTLDYNANGEGGLGYDATDARETFNRIEPYDYFDLALTFAIARRFTLRFAANNLLDKTPPIIANSYGVSLNYNNTVSSRYDQLGRNIAVGTSVSF